jgi:hypothetical protein
MNEAEREVMQGFEVEKSSHKQNDKVGLGKKVPFFNRIIFLDEKYYVYSPGEKRNDLTQKQMDTYLAIKNMQGVDQIKYLMELNMYHPDCNPNIHILTGRELLEFSEQYSAIPVFDKDFDVTRRLQFQPLNAYKYLMEKKKLRDAKERLIRGEI